MPVVDIYIEDLFILLKKNEFPCTRSQHQYAFHYSCDVDTPTIWYNSQFSDFTRYAVASIIKYRSLQRFMTIVKARKRIQSDLFFTFPYIFKQLSSHGIQGRFNIKGGIVATCHDFPYKLNEQHIKKLLLDICEQGHEIGFHPSYNTRDSYTLFLEELERVKATSDQPIRGGRQHYLRFSGSRTWRMWNDAGLSYDSTCGYRRCTGFRMGTCRPFPVYDLLARSTLNLIEYPLIIMDCALLHQLPDPDQARDHAAKLNEWVRAFNGVMTLLWHNSFFETQAKKILFEELLHICA